MSITAYGSGAYRAVKPQSFVSTRSELDVLQQQLATKKKSETYGGLGLDRRVSLDFNAKVERIDSWLEGIDLADVNVKLISQSLSGYSSILSDFGKLTNDSKNSTAGGLYSPTAGGRSVSQTLAESQLTQTIDLLNTKVNGRYLFSGRETETEPVVHAEIMFDGEPGRDGLKQMIAERKTADLGVAPETGRVAVGGAAGSNQVTLTESGGNALYGFDLNKTAQHAASTLSPSFTITNAAAGITIDVATQPAIGEIVRIPLALPDGTTEVIELRVRAAGSSTEKDTFELGADTAATAANMRVALRDSVDKVAKSALVSSSAMIAAQNFFEGTAASPPLRVPAPAATTTAAPTRPANTTVIWYKGDDNPPTDIAAIRATAAVQVGEQQRIGLGLQANERPFQIGLAAMAAFAVESFAANDPVNEPYPREHYAALAQRANVLSKPTVDGDAASSIITEFGGKQKLLASAKQQQTTTKTYYESTLTSVEGVTSEEVAVQILALQTQLQATYQTTSILSKLTLTNYL